MTHTSHVSSVSWIITLLKISSSALIQEVKDRLDEFGRAYSSGNAKAMMDMFADDLQFMPPGTKLITTKDGIYVSQFCYIYTYNPYTIS